MTTMSGVQPHVLFGAKSSSGGGRSGGSGRSSSFHISSGSSSARSSASRVSSSRVATSRTSSTKAHTSTPKAKAASSAKARVSSPKSKATSTPQVQVSTSSSKAVKTAKMASAYRPAKTANTYTVPDNVTVRVLHQFAQMPSQFYRASTLSHAFLPEVPRQQPLGFSFCNSLGSAGIMPPPPPLPYYSAPYIQAEAPRRESGTGGLLKLMGLVSIPLIFLYLFGGSVQATNSGKCLLSYIPSKIAPLKAWVKDLGQALTQVVKSTKNKSLLTSIKTMTEKVGQLATTQLTKLAKAA